MVDRASVWLYIRQACQLTASRRGLKNKIKLGLPLLIQIPPTTFWKKNICRAYLKTL